MKSQENYMQSLIHSAFRNPSAIDELWCCERKISSILNLAVTQCSSIQNENAFSTCCDYFIEYICIFLIKKPSDFLYIFTDFTSQKHKNLFMNLYFQNYLTNSLITNSLLDNTNIIQCIGEHSKWIEYPLKYRAAQHIPNAENKSLEIHHLYPLSLELSDSLKEYLVSWAFEDDKLSDKAIEYFQNTFPKQYDLLNNKKQNIP
ncbi:hypothetical protein [Commensalibacter oyaizuii]|uniref:DUF1524 domain-containing protein n=1 Tax=Commensalibacter oyaizuii TaxID=3043873 RepID=A0ABT6PY33_9PROT|nr:hypothetical protein [Commensalibacter sp. TBRC 16381]MDI2089773.1 hypothetical protein [Commensalibacter sp. TBRC 16381]